MSDISHRSAAQGFSLLELLVALAIGALLLGILGNALGGIMATTRTTLVENGEQEERMTSTRVIRDILINALPPNPADLSRPFVGSRDEMVFSATPPESLLPFGALRVRLYLDREASSAASLLMDVTSAAGPGKDRSLELRRQRLYRDVASVSIHYSDSRNADAQNQDSWRDTKRLPSLISLAITRTGGKQPITITAMPRRNLSGYCRFDPISLECRS